MTKQEHVFQKDIEGEGKEIAWNVVGGLNNGDVLPLPKTNLFRMGNAFKAKKKKRERQYPKTFEFDPISIKLDLEI